MRMNYTEFIKKAKRILLMAGVACACLGYVSCGIRQQPAAGLALQAPAEQTGASLHQVPAALAGLPEVSRLVSAASDFLPFQNGADFASDLPNNRCTVSGTDAILAPAYVAPNRALTDAAYCLYRLELDPVATDATLTMVWNGAAPDSALCWVGLANWQSGLWDWQPLATSALPVSNPALYGDASKHCYAALVLLGDVAADLVSISYGPLPPPPNRGYTLFAPLVSTSEYLIDNDFNVVKEWTGTLPHGMAVLLDENGYLWRQLELNNPQFKIGGNGGRLEKVDWDSNVVWSYELSTDTQCTHHDFKVLANGHVLLTVWNKLPPVLAIAAGRDPASIGPEGIYVDSIIEIDPEQPAPSIVWQWNTMDHLVQDFDSLQANYGDPAAHPELVDINYSATPGDDWTHINTVDYNPELDQIALSVLGLSEMWIIDHSTTTKEAAEHTGGRYGRGGDLLYRWGNPIAYRAGTIADRKLFTQHDVQWIKPGLAGEGNFLIFNNRAGMWEGRQYSTVVEITPPMNPDGSYYMTGSVFGPDTLAWEYIGDPPEKFFSINVSGAQRLPDGNTLICEGQNGRFFEVTAAGEITWEYVNPFPQLGQVVFRALRYQADYPGLANLTP